MKNKSLQRVLSLILCAFLCVGLLPASAFAEAEVLEVPATEEIDFEEPVVEPVGDGALDVPVILSGESEANEAEGSFPEEPDPSPEAQNDMGADVSGIPEAVEEPAEEPVGDGALDVPEEPAEEPEPVEGPVAEESAEEPVGDGALDVPEAIEEPVVEEPVAESVEADADPQPDVQEVPEEPAEEIQEEEAPTAETESDEAALASSGTCGANLTWTLDNEGTLTISGTGAMNDFEYKSSPWCSFRYSVRAIQIEPGVTSIGNYTFSGCSSLTNVAIPASVMRIGVNAFSGCSSLIKIDIP